MLNSIATRDIFMIHITNVWTAIHHDRKLVSKEVLELSPSFAGNVYADWGYTDCYVPMYSLRKNYLFQMSFAQ